MKRALLGFALLCALPLYASNTTVTATVTDTDGQVWYGGTFTAVLTTTGGLTGSQQVPTVGGVAVPARVTGTLNGSGVLSATLTDVSSLDQAGGFWTITVCPQTSVSPLSPNSCFVAKPNIVGASVNLTGNFSTVPAPRFPSGMLAFGYLDAEVIIPSSPGSTYYNLTQGVRVWTGSAWTSIAVGGGGTTSCATTTNILAGDGTAGGCVSSGIAASNLVTLSGTQTISGAKTFSSIVALSNDLLLNDSQYVRDNSGGQLQFVNPSSGSTQILNQGGAFSAASGTIAGTQINSSYAPSSGTATFTPLSVNAIINGTSTGKAYGMVVSTSTNVFTGGTIHSFSVGTATGNQLAGYSEKMYVGLAGDVHPSVVAVASLPAAATVAAGGMMVVNDSNVTTVGTCTGGGANLMIAVSTGSAWVCH